jgi:hypothetical protein
VVSEQIIEQNDEDIRVQVIEHFPQLLEHLLGTDKH